MKINRKEVTLNVPTSVPHSQKLWAIVKSIGTGDYGSQEEAGKRWYSPKS